VLLCYDKTTQVHLYEINATIHETIGLQGNIIAIL
jgi:hypothetical protein